MSEEIKVTQEEKCICQNKYFKKFLVTSFATFVGAFCALSLFAALNKPTMPPMMYPYMMPHSPMMHQHFGHGCNCHHGQEFKKKHFENKIEFYKKMHENNMKSKD